MNRLQRTFLLAATLLIAVPLAALSKLTPVQLEENRAELHKIRRDEPAEYERLRRATQQFLELPEERREQIIQLRERLERLPAADRVRLIRVMERYTLWLKRLPPSDRERIRNAPNKNARLQIIRQLRLREWIARQPIAVQRRLQQMSGFERMRAIRGLRAEEDMRRRQWAVARRFWKDLNAGVPLPASLEHLPRITQQYVKRQLLPLLAPEEKARLARAQGRWPLFPKTLVELADRYYVPLSGESGPKSHSELPANIQYFVRDHLSLHLDDEEKMELTEVEGKWPEYVQTLQGLAHQHRLRIPWEHLPPRGRFFNWNLYRFAPFIDSVTSKSPK